MPVKLERTVAHPLVRPADLLRVQLLRRARRVPAHPEQLQVAEPLVASARPLQRPLRLAQREPNCLAVSAMAAAAAAARRAAISMARTADCTEQVVEARCMEELPVLALKA
jgi:hypothetical protein